MRTDQNAYKQKHQSERVKKRKMRQMFRTKKKQKKTEEQYREKEKRKTYRKWRRKKKSSTFFLNQLSPSYVLVTCKKNRLVLAD